MKLTKLQTIVCCIYAAANIVEYLTTGATAVELIIGLAFMPCACLALNYASRSADKR